MNIIIMDLKALLSSRQFKSSRSFMLDLIIRLDVCIKPEAG